MGSHLPNSTAVRKLTPKILASLLTLGVGACGFSSAEIPLRNISIHQTWALQPGSEVGGYPVVGSLGDVSIRLGGSAVKAPFDGKVQPTHHECVAFSSPEVPAYLFRLCGVNRPRLGKIEAGQVIGRGQVLQFAAMRRQPNGTWAMVEPAVDVLERTVGN